MQLSPPREISNQPIHFSTKINKQLTRQSTKHYPCNFCVIQRPEFLVITLASHFKLHGTGGKNQV